MDSSAFAVRYLDFAGREYTGGEITREVVDQLLNKIRAGKAFSFLLSLDEYGEDGGDFLSGDMEKGWAALALNTWDEEGEAHLMLPVNDGCDGAELAPVEIGGQSPVLKHHALDDLNLAAECVLHFARTGELYPGLQWEEPDPEAMYF